MGGEDLRDVIRRACSVRADNDSILFLARGTLKQRLTGAELMARTEACAAQFRPLQNKCLALVFPPGPDFVIALLGCLFAGVTAIPVSPPRRGSAGTRLAHICREARPAAVLCAPAQTEATRNLLEHGSVPVVAFANGRLHQDLPTDTSGCDVSGAALVQYTSGSTQDPKGVVLTGNNILTNFRLVERTWQMDAQSRIVNWMPHFHDMGLMGGILYPLCAGGVSIQMSPYDFIRSPLSWLRAISDWKATFSGGPAFAFADLLQRISQEQIASLDLSSWTRAYCGAEPVPPGLLDRVAAHLAPAGLRPEALFACYGLAEMTLFAAGRPRDPAAPDHSCGMTPELTQSISIVNPDTHEPVAPGQSGEIWITGASQGAGYLGRPELSAQVFDQRLPGREARYFRTGDLGRMDQGLLHISGRLKDVVFAHGLTIPAVELERCATAHCAAANPFAACAFMPSETRSGHVALIFETRDGTAPKEAEARNMRSSLAAEWGLVLDDILAIGRGKLPRTTSGKIRRAEVARLYRSGGFSADRVGAL